MAAVIRCFKLWMNDMWKTFRNDHQCRNAACTARVTVPVRGTNTGTMPDTMFNSAAHAPGRQHRHDRVHHPWCGDETRGHHADPRPCPALEPADLPYLARLHRDAYAGQPRRRNTGQPAISTGEDRTCTAQAASLIAYGPDGQITAAIIITERDGEAIIDELFTLPNYRRQGMAEELLRPCMHVLHTLGRATVTVTVDDSNSAALALYLSRDFRRVAARDGEDE